jgi:hypothetical protein
MSETVNLTLTKDEAILLDSCLNALQIIMFNGTSESKSTEEQAKENGVTLQQIQSKIPKFI